MPADGACLAPDPALAAAVAAACPALRGHPWQGLSGGRINRLWRVGGAVVKAYRPERASPLFPNDPQAEARVLRHLAGRGLAPVLLAQGAGWIVYRHCPGRIWQQGPAPVARALGAVHRLAPPPGLRALPMGGAAIMAAARGLPVPAGLPLMPRADAPAPARRVLVHGDPVPGNLILRAGRVVLIDWQCPGAGDPVDDLALFLSPAMQALYRGAPLSAGESAAFLAAYPDGATVARYLALRPLLHWRIAAHCALRAAQGATDYAAALRLELALLPATAAG